MTIRHKLSNIMLEVADQGSGIPSETRQEVFEPLFGQKAVGGGLGLGLTAAKTITEHHGASIEIADNQPAGSLLLVRFPAVVV